MLIVEDDLPKHLKQSMFEKAGEYPVVCRYSSEPGDPGLDVYILTSLYNDEEGERLTHIGSHPPTTRLRDESLQRPRRDV